MNDNILLGFLIPILGKHKITAHDNVAFKCPFGAPHEKCQRPGKLKLEVNVITTPEGENSWHCWVCGAKGKTIRSLLYKLGLPEEKISYIQSYVKKEKSANPREIREMSPVSLPKEFISLYDKTSSYERKKALQYCKKRGLTLNDILKYNIGYCSSGHYSNNIIFPSYDKNGDINYFLARSYLPQGRTFNAPECDKDNIIGFELYINWNTPIILCEGPFDASAIKRNVIPLFGKTISKALMKRLIMPDVKTIYLALDKDALHQTIKYAEELISMGKEVYVIDLTDKDPSEMGFEEFTKLIHTATPLSFAKLLLTKLEM
jgi:DNA primase